MMSLGACGWNERNDAGVPATTPEKCVQCSSLMSDTVCRMNHCVSAVKAAAFHITFGQMSGTQLEDACLF